jgi:hypothetical protein
VEASATAPKLPAPNAPEIPAEPSFRSECATFSRRRPRQKETSEEFRASQEAERLGMLGGWPPPTYAQGSSGGSHARQQR